MRRYCCPYICEDSLNCDVSNETDILTSHLGQAIVYANGELKDELIEVSNLLFAFMSALRMNREFKREYVEYIEGLETKYKSQLLEKKLFVIPTGNQLSASLHLCRAYAKKASRMYFKFEGSSDFNNDDMSDFINILSTMFYNIAKHVNQEANITEIEVRR